MEDAVPVPDTEVEQDSYGASNPPTGTAIENCIVDPETVPDTVPRPVTFIVGSAIVNVPENDEPDWVICQRIVPDPDESDAVPVHAPLRLAGVDGGEGLLGDDDPPPHEDTTIARRSAA